MDLRKKKCFDNFAQNFIHLRNTIGLQINLQSNQFKINNPDAIYLCPLSYSGYFEDSLNRDSPHRLDWEHAPQKALGGKKVALTSKEKNNKASKIDKVLSIENNQKATGDYIISADFGGYFIKHATISNINKSKPSINVKCSEFTLNKLKPLFEEKQSVEVKIKFTFLRNTKIAYLKNAHILAFASLGNGYLFHWKYLFDTPQRIIAEQINNPDKIYLKDYLIWEDSFPDEMLGVNYIVKPKTTPALFVVYDLKNEGGSKRRIGVMLPNVIDKTFTSLKRARKIIKANNIFDFSVINIPKMDITTLENSLLYWELLKMK